MARYTAEEARELLRKFSNGEASFDYHDGTNSQDFIVPIAVGLRGEDVDIGIDNLTPAEAFAVGVLMESIR